jgi:ADP-heptose:LPS heptosyltransferase
LKKILVIRFSSIGDIVLTTPVVRGLKQQLGAEVHYLTKRSFRAIVDPNPYIDKVYAIDKRVGEVLPALRAEGYDAVVDLHKNLRSRQVRLALWRTPFHAFDKLNWEKWLLVRFQVDRLPALHIVDRYLEAAAPLGVRNDGRGLDYFIPPEEEVDVGQWLADNKTTDNEAFPPVLGRRAEVAFPTRLPHPDNESTNNEFIAFAIGAAHATKRLPREQLIAVCRGIDRPVFLLGGPGDAEEGAAVAAAAGAHVFNACGRLSLHQSASVLRQAAAVITHDTGLMHIAAAFGKPIVSVWGNTVPAFGMYPYLPEGPAPAIIEVEGLTCRPCSKIGYQACPQGHFRCMRDIRPEAVWQALEERRD